MIKLQTPVAETPCSVSISYGDRIMILGSCFSDSIGKSLIDYGFDAMVNPFGTLYNPASIRSAIRRLASGKKFTEADCVPMGALPKGRGRSDRESVDSVSDDDSQAGAGTGKICSFSHHTSFARETSAEFLENANASLRAASEFFRSCNKVIITIGTAWGFRHLGSPEIDRSNTGWIVSNCLKRDAKEFSRERLSVSDCTYYLDDIIHLCKGPNRKKKRYPSECETSLWNLMYSPAWNEFRFKEIIFTVSPIRHIGDGAHGNQLSKSALLLAVDKVISGQTNETRAMRDPNTACTKGLDYFPAYEIMMDELRDYRFWAEDMVHPSAQAAAYITDRFLSRHLSPADRARLDANIRAYKHSLHRPIL
ncbi:MAG: GSCFA domain-containing protein [Bacteroidales bacterium]|nr:GSCFA domain-containing protein [Bacteroidales bacterium]